MSAIIDKWAPLVSGYIEHQIISDRQSTWSFKGDLGFVKKTVKLRIDITEWTEPTRVKSKAPKPDPAINAVHLRMDSICFGFHSAGNNDTLG